MEATVILQLVGEGKLKLDDKLSAVLPEMAERDDVGIGPTRSPCSS